MSLPIAASARMPAALCPSGLPSAPLSQPSGVDCWGVSDPHFAAPCGGGYVMYWRDRLACFGARSRGTCTNRLTISRQEVEERVLVALRDKLMRRDLFEDFCREYVRELNRLRMEHRANLSHGLGPRS